MLVSVLLAFLLGAAICDLASHRLPNCYLLLGALAALALQLWVVGPMGGVVGGAGLMTGFAVFLPFYVMGGMAAGDVKLMAVVGSFLGAAGALWAAACSLIAGAVLGVIYLLYKGHFCRLAARYWAMASLRARIPAEDDDAARHRFPYAIAIAAGTLLSLYWTPI
ncbi:Type IV leader peptidase family protein [compost metagenome]